MVSTYLYILKIKNEIKKIQSLPMKIELDRKTSILVLRILKKK